MKDYRKHKRLQSRTRRFTEDDKAELCPTLSLSALLSLVEQTTVSSYLYMTLV